MKRTTWAAATAAFTFASAGAFAQTAPAPSASIYGVLDTGLEYIDKVGATGASLTRMPTNTASIPSRLGFRGTEDLGGGLRALFTLEMGLGLDAGALNQGGRLFGRQSFVGLSGPWGTVSLGRQYTMLFWSILDADILGPNIYGSGSMDSYIPNARADNAIAYRGTFNGFTVGATYSLGRDAVNAGPSPAGTNCPGENAQDKAQCREWSVMAKYDAPQWGVAAVADEIRGGPGAFGGLTTSAAKDRRTMLNGYTKIDKWKLGAGYKQRRTTGAAPGRNGLLFVGAAYQLTPQILLDGEAFRLKYRSSANQATLVAARATYSFSKRTAAYVTAGHVGNEGALALSVSGGQPGSNPAAGGSQNGVMLGIRHSF